jgi:hypothetical protein
MKKNSYTNSQKLSFLFCFLVTTALGITTECYAQEQLHTKTISIVGPKDKEKRDSTFAAVTEASFEIALYSMNQGQRFSARRKIEEPKIGQEFRMITLFIADADGTDVYFKDAADFINYMDAHGYEMTSETKQRFRTDYVFKKK